MKHEDSSRAYVDRITSETRTAVQEILGENDRLRQKIAVLEVERERLQGALERATADLETRESLQAALERKLLEADRERRDYSSRFVEVEQQNTNLANLYVASHQLHGTLDRAGVLAAIQEIIINLVGSEELAIYVYNDDGATLRLAASFGIRAEPQLAPADPIALLAASGALFIAPPGAELADDAPRACIPLVVDDVRVGVVAVYRLLPHKAELQDVDRELFELLATHAAAALLCSSLHQKCISGAVA